MGKKILFINQEIAPFVPDSEFSLLSRNLSQAMQEKGHEIRTFMPKWGAVNERRGQLHEVIRLSGMNLIINESDHPLVIKVASIPGTRVQVYFIDNDEYFHKRQIGSDEKGTDYADNGERAVFFARGVLEAVKKQRWVPDVILCQGWITSLIPLYVKTAYRDEPSFKGVKVITSLTAKELKKDLGKNFKQLMEYKSVKPSLLKNYKDKFNWEELCKLAIDYSDALVQIQPDVTEKLLAHADETGLPMLTLTDGSEVGSLYHEFIESLF